MCSSLGVTFSFPNRCMCFNDSDEIWVISLSVLTGMSLVGVSALRLMSECMMEEYCIGIL